MRRIALIGAGVIAQSHLAALRPIGGARVSAVVDVDPAKAEALAAQAGGGARAFASVAALLAAEKPDAAHVLTPPPFHRTAAEPLLRAGVHVLLEKPMAETAEDCAALIVAAQDGGAGLVVNHNFLFHPVFLKLKAALASGRFGPLEAVALRYAAPLRQLDSRAFGHWMFDSPRNLLLEQAVHPLSQLDDMIGPIGAVTATPGPMLRPEPHVGVAADWSLALQGPRLGATAQIKLGAHFPSWTISALCSDGVIEADLYEGRLTTRRPHAEIGPVDAARRNLSQGAMSLAAGARGLWAYGAELARLGGPSDGFRAAMGAAVADFHARLDKGDHRADDLGLRLVRLCEEAARAAPPAPAAPAILRPDAGARYDVGVIGGTGFIGRALTSALTREGLRVAVMARGAKRLPEVFASRLVGLHPGSTADASAVAEFVRRAPKLVNLAHGGGGSSRAAVLAALAGGAETVAQAALAAGCERLLFISSSAALYLGDPAETITAATPPDLKPDERGDYAAAKITAEAAMLRLHREKGLPVAILRPAVVVGAGASPFHSALGAFNTEAHCLGWSAGRHALPFVLAEDVASAIVAALKAPLDAINGKSFNLVGDVRWSARRYLEELAKATGRPLVYHSSSLTGLMMMERAKWLAKRIAGRRDAAAPSRRDLASRAMAAPFDTSFEQRLLGWSPVRDESEFHRLAIGVHAA